MFLSGTSDDTPGKPFMFILTISLMPQFLYFIGVSGTVILRHFDGSRWIIISPAFVHSVAFIAVGFLPSQNFGAMLLWIFGSAFTQGCVVGQASPLWICFCPLLVIGNHAGNASTPTVARGATASNTWLPRKMLAAHGLNYTHGGM